MNQRGVSSLITILFLCFLATVILASIQTRVLVGVTRSGGARDSLASVYASESEIHDTIARFLDGYTIDPSPPDRTLPDGTELRVAIDTIEGRRTIDIVASRPYASTHLQAVWQGTQSQTTRNQNLDIIISLDCTGSMGACADNASDYTTCAKSTSMRPTSMEELRRGAITFLQELELLPVGSLRIGISVFASDANWMNSARGVPLSLTQNQTIEDAIVDIQNGFGKTPAKSPACTSVFDAGTSIGTGIPFMHQELAAAARLDTKGVEVLITDGAPTMAAPYPLCGEDYFIPFQQSHMQQYCPKQFPVGFSGQPWQCRPQGTAFAWGTSDASYRADAHAKSFLSCMLADTKTTWKNSEKGFRHPAVESYIVTTFRLPQNDQTRQILEAYPGTHYYSMDNATQLSEILSGQVTQTIRTSIEHIEIKRVLPGVP